MSAAAVRAGLVDRLRRNLVGPSAPEDADLAEELLPAGETPSRWYLTGFLAPSGETPVAPVDGDEIELEEGEGYPVAASDDEQPDRPPSGRRFLPSSIGLTAMVDADVATIEAEVSWGDYRPEPALPPEMLGGAGSESVAWRRVPCARTMTVPLPGEDDGLVTHAVPASGASGFPGGGLELAVRARPFALRLATGGERAVRLVTVFLVNKRRELASSFRDLTYAYQATLALRCANGFVPQHDLSRVARDEWDDRLADLHYRDAAAYAAGLGCAVEHVVEGGMVRVVRTTHLPRAAVERTIPAEVAGVEFGMDRLADLAREGGEALQTALAPLADAYAGWSAQQHRLAADDPGVAGSPQRRATAAELIRGQAHARERIAAGIALLARGDPGAVRPRRHAHLSPAGRRPPRQLLRADERRERGGPGALVRQDRRGGAGAEAGVPPGAGHPAGRGAGFGG